MKNKISIAIFTVIVGIAVYVGLQKINSTSLNFNNENEASLNPLNKNKATTQAPEIDLPNLMGTNIKLSSLKGKIVLLDFWASWCPPCREENKNLVRIANNLTNNSNFVIYSVSLDTDKKQWENAIKHDKLSWPNHVSDLKKWNSVAAKSYNIERIPFTYLIDKEGNIVASDIHGAELEAKINELIK